MRRNTIDIITLGCSKNLVDSEKLIRQLEANGYKVKKVRCTDMFPHSTHVETCALLVKTSEA